MVEIQATWTQPFDKKESWKAYNEFFWSNRREELHAAAQQIVDNLPGSSSDQPIQVLILGIGTGTMELPLLAELERTARRKVRIVALDTHKEPMHFASRLLEMGLGNLPTEVNDVLQLLDKEGWQNLPKQNFWKQGDHLFVCDNLDFDIDTNSKEHSHIANSSMPSQWQTRLEHNHENSLPFRGFDLCLASLFLPHLTWWRSTLVSALSLLREDGLFLHSYVRGDAEILEGKVSSVGKILKNREPKQRIRHDNAIMKAVFLDKNGFFSHTEVAEYSNFSRSATPILPFSIETFFSYIEGYGLKQIPSLSYLIQSSPTSSTYYALLKNRTNSPFRVVEHEILKSSTKYNEVVENVRLSTKDISPDKYDQLINLFTWSGFKVVNAKDLRTSPLSSKFTINASTDNTSSRKTREYELEAATLDVGLQKPKQSAVEFAEEVVKNMTSAGVISSSCVGGLIVSFSRETPSIRAFCNPLYPSNSVDRKKFLTDLCLYLRFREMGYTSTGTLINNLLPESNKTCIFTCRLRRTQEEDDKVNLIDLDIIQHNTFKEVQFILSHRLRDCIRQDVALLPGVREYESKFSEMLDELSQILDLGSEIFTFPPLNNSEYPNFLDDHVREQWKKIIDFDNLTDRLRQEVREVGGDTPKFIKTLEDCITPTLMNGIAPIPIISSFQTCVTYPAIYIVNNKSSAEDAIILFYDSSFVLSQEIEHEFKKIELMYNRIGISKTQSQGKREGVRGITERFGHETRWINHSVRQISTYIEEEMHVREDNLRIMSLLRDGAFDYIDLWATNTNSEEYPIDLETAIESAKRIGFLRKFHSLQPQKMLENKHLFLNLLDRISIRVDISPNAISLERSASLEKAIKAAVSNAVQHSLPENQSFEDLRGSHDIYAILVIHADDTLSIYNPGFYKPDNSKPASTLSVIQDQTEHLKGVGIPTMVTLKENDLTQKEKQLLSQHQISLPVVRTQIPFDRSVWLS